MERLTEKIMKIGTKKVSAYRIKCHKGIEAVQKLGKYEDLEEQCIEENMFCLRMLLKKWKEFMDDIKELYEYRELEEQGKLLKPKCVPGDYVWEANKERNIISEYEISSIRYGINKTVHYIWVLRIGIYSDLEGFF